MRRAVQFLENSTQNPLAFGPNETTRSDFRIFNSDGGNLIRKLATSPDLFLETCGNLFQRMVDTVPKDVQLSRIITPIRLKPDRISITIDDNGNMTITGDIRVCLVSLISHLIRGKIYQVINRFG